MDEYKVLINPDGVMNCNGKKGLFFCGYAHNKTKQTNSKLFWKERLPSMTWEQFMEEFTTEILSKKEERYV